MITRGNFKNYFKTVLKLNSISFGKIFSSLHFLLYFILETSRLSHLDTRGSSWISWHWKEEVWSISETLEDSRLVPPGVWGLDTGFCLGVAGPALLFCVCSMHCCCLWFWHVRRPWVLHTLLSPSQTLKLLPLTGSQPLCSNAMFFWGDDSTKWLSFFKRENHDSYKNKMNTWQR